MIWAVIKSPLSGYVNGLGLGLFSCRPDLADVFSTKMIVDFVNGLGLGLGLGLDLGLTSGATANPGLHIRPDN